MPKRKLDPSDRFTPGDITKVVNPRGYHPPFGLTVQNGGPDQIRVTSAYVIQPGDVVVVLEEGSVEVKIMHPVAGVGWIEDELLADII